MSDFTDKMPVFIACGDDEVLPAIQTQRDVEPSSSIRGSGVWLMSPQGPLRPLIKMDPSAANLQRQSMAHLVRLLLVLAALATVAFPLWRLAWVVLLGFASALVAVGLRAAADPIRDRTPLGDKLSVALAAAMIAAVVAGFIVLAGAQLQAQINQLAAQLPDLVADIEDRTGIQNLQERLIEQAEDTSDDPGTFWTIAGYSLWTAGLLGNVLLVLVAGLYLAIHPRRYVRGLVRLLPGHRQREADRLLRAIGMRLRLWLLGQLGAMLLVGILITGGLWLIGVPSALALGFIAGLFEFVPFIGPIAAAFPAIALALAESPQTALWTAALYLLVQQIEGNAITPLIQQQAAHLPPVLTLFAVIGFGVLFGPLGVILATPLAVVCLVLVEKLWLQEPIDE